MPKPIGLPFDDPGGNRLVEVKGAGTVMWVFRYLNPAFCRVRLGATLKALGSQKSRCTAEVFWEVHHRTWA